MHLFQINCEPTIESHFMVFSPKQTVDYLFIFSTIVQHRFFGVRSMVVVLGCIKERSLDMVSIKFTHKRV